MRGCCDYGRDTRAFANGISFLDIQVQAGKDDGNRDRLSVQESPEGGYEAKALGYSIYTQAETLSDLKEALKDAVRCRFGDDHAFKVTQSR
jgi:hypothetical protein